MYVEAIGCDTFLSKKMGLNVLVCEANFGYVVCR